MKQTEYRVIVKENSHDLIVDINKFLKEGWVCQGGISLSLDSYGSFIYAQAIIKTKQSGGGMVDAKLKAVRMEWEGGYDTQVG